MTGKEMAEQMSNFVNAYGTDQKGFVKTLANDHPTLQQSAVCLAIAFLREMANKEYTDGRNERAVNAARIMINALDEAQAGSLPLI